MRGVGLQRPRRAPRARRFAPVARMLAVISQWRRLSNGVKDKFNADAAALEGQFKLHLEVIALRDEHAMLTAELEARKARRRRRFTAVKKTGTVALDGDGDDVV